MSVKEICFAETCTYRKQVSENKAFCMLPRCPHQMTKYVMPKGRVLSENATISDVVKRNRKLGLIP